MKMLLLALRKFYNVTNLQFENTFNRETISPWFRRFTDPQIAKLLNKALIDHPASVSPYTDIALAIEAFYLAH